MNRRDALKSFVAAFAGMALPWREAAPASVSYDVGVRYMPNASREQIIATAEKIMHDLRMDFMRRENERAFQP